MTERDIPPCQIYIDREGKWFHKGAEMVHREIIRHFYENMDVDANGRYIIHLQGDTCYLEVEDTPFVVRRALFKGPEGNGSSRVILYLSDDRREDLSPATLHTGKGNVLYCRIRNGIFPARFSRAAYYQIADHIEEEAGRYFLPLNGKKYFIETEA